MNFFNKFFKGNKEGNIDENPFFTIFKGAFPKGTDFSDCLVYHIKSFEYTYFNMELFHKNKNKENFFRVLDKLEYNSQVNNVGIYYVIKPEGHGIIYLLSDPVELLEKESVMEKHEMILDERIMALNTVKRIN